MRIESCIKRLERKFWFIRTKPWYIRNIKPYYSKVQHAVACLDCLARGPDTDAIAFYTQNATRVNAIADRLADERSRNEYLCIIKFRQSRHRKDYPLCDAKSPQYFIEEMTLGGNEVFVDCGAFVGDTIDAFLQRSPSYTHIIAFEPDESNFKVCQQKHGNNPKITLYNAGVHDTDAHVQFLALGNGTSEITEGQKGTGVISVKAIDGLDLGRITFLKMDIEGAELKALKGAEKTLLRDKPKLAICIYHSKEDMLDIAEYIQALVPEYRLYVRHHTQWPYDGETVVYARMP